MAKQHEVSNAIDRGTVTTDDSMINVPVPVHMVNEKFMSLHHEYVKGEIDYEKFRYCVYIASGRLMIDFAEKGRCEVSPTELVKACYKALKGKEVTNG